MKKVPKLKIDIRSQADDNTATIDIDGEIGWASWDGEDYTWNTPEAIKKKLREIQDLKAEKIVVNINSLGGFVNDGLAIHDVLAMHPAQIETRVTGMTASAATIIAQAGDVRKMSENALYLIHKSWGLTIGNAMDHLEAVEELETIDKRMLSIYAKRSGKSEDEILSLMEESNGAGKWIDHQQALEMGLIDEAFEPMKAAASARLSHIMAAGLPVPSGLSEEKKSKLVATIQVDTDQIINHIDDFKKEFVSYVVEHGIMSQEQADEFLNAKENDSSSEDSGEVVPGGISHYEAQIKVNHNYK